MLLTAYKGGAHSGIWPLEYGESLEAAFGGLHIAVFQETEDGVRKSSGTKY